jgi:hypothetical protein
VPGADERGEDTSFEDALAVELPAGGDVKGAIAVPGPLVLLTLVITGAVTTA